VIDEGNASDLGLATSKMSFAVSGITQLEAASRKPQVLAPSAQYQRDEE
jgi:hypothetical protein